MATAIVAAVVVLRVVPSAPPGTAKAAAPLRAAAVAWSPSGPRFHTTIADLGEASGATLTGYPAATSFTAPVPVDAGPERLQLVLDGRTQVGQGEDVVLSVVVNGTTAYRQRLAPGRRTLAAVIALPTTDAADGSIHVTVSTSGTSDAAGCGGDASDVTGSLVTLDPTSGVRGSLARRVTTIRDQLATLGRHVVLATPTAVRDPRWAALVATLGAELVRRGHRVTDVALARLTGSDVAGSSVIELRPDSTHAWLRVARLDGANALVVARPRTAALHEVMFGDAGEILDRATARGARLPHLRTRRTRTTLEALGASTSAKSVARMQTWHGSFSLESLPAGRVPSGVRVALALPATPRGVLVDAELDGDLLASRRVARHGRVAVSFPIPARDLALNDSLTVHVQILGVRCRASTSYPVQLLPQSSLRLSRGSLPGLLGLPAAYGDGVVLRLTGTGERPATMSWLDSVLATTVPEGAPIHVVVGARHAPTRPFIVVRSTDGGRAPRGSVLLSRATRRGVPGLVVRPQGTPPPSVAAELTLGRTSTQLLVPGAAGLAVGRS